MSQRSYSYSQIQTAYTCLKKFKLLVVDKMQVPPSGDMQFGTAMHAGVQAILEQADGLQVFDTFWQSLKDREVAYGRSDWEDLKRQGEILLTRFQRLHAKKFEAFKIEERIYTKLGDLSIEGTPDYVGKFEGVPSIIDFKTAGYRYEKERLICNEQMPLYDHMAKKEWDYHAEQYVYLVFVKGKDPSIQTLVRPVDAAARERTLNNIVAVCKELDTRTEWHENRGSCLIGTNKCPFFEVCHGRSE